uniref:Uncharacterized protein n=1 Tax=Anopheles culicifacies TaxID=139723 RepID=A0A182MVR6_9DIPT
MVARRRDSIGRAPSQYGNARDTPRTRCYQLPTQFLNVTLQQLLVVSAHVQYLEVGLVELQQCATLNRMLHEGRYMMIEADTEQPLAYLAGVFVCNRESQTLIKVIEEQDREHFTCSLDHSSTGPFFHWCVSRIRSLEKLDVEPDRSSVRLGE